MALVSQAISWGHTATTATTLTTLTTATTLFTLIFTSPMGSLTSVPRGTTWHWCLRPFHGVIQLLQLLHLPHLLQLLHFLHLSLLHLWGHLLLCLEATTWHWCLRTFHGVIHELLTHRYTGSLPDRFVHPIYKWE